MQNILSSEEKIFPCFWQAVLLLSISFLALFFTGVGIEVLKVAGEMLKNEAMVFTAAFLLPMANLILIPISVGVIYFTKTPFKKIFHFKAKNIIYILPLIILILGSGIIESEMDNIVRYFLPMPKFIQNIMEAMIRDKWSSFVVLVFIASLTEELLCRGVILRGFLTHYNKGTAIIFSAMLFSLFHVNIYQFSSAFMLGLILGWIYAETRSIYLCFFTHSFHNLLCWLFAFRIIRLKIPGYTFDKKIDYNIVEFQPVWLNLTGVALIVIGILLLKKIFSCCKNEEKIEERGIQNQAVNNIKCTSHSGNNIA